MMRWADFINGMFEVVGGAMVFDHCRALYRDKELKGVSILATSVFFTWGLWNLYYYPSLGQWLSFAGGCSIVVANGTCVGLMLYYGRKA